jgi:hypothetical protein
MNYKHGSAGSPTYNAWANMKQRCLNLNHPDYTHYGGRGINICNEWLTYENFYANMGECPDGLQLERLDNEKGYCKENCAWTTKQKQMFNRRTFRNNTSKITGVAWHSRDHKWLAYAGNGGCIRLYSGSDFLEACCARKSWEVYGKKAS